MPPYVKIVLNNEFPRSHITTHLTRTAGLYFGPFRSRASAERFEGQFLDLFQMRRCQEDLVPSPEHPGCIYGEMGMCLRPCQEVVGPAEYGHEVDRVVEFLRTDGRSLLEAIGHSRDRLSEEMMFEEAARQHKRYEKVQEVLKLRDELARDVDRLNGVAITRSLAPDAVEMWFVREGNWQEPQRFGFEVQEGKPVSLDRKLRETFACDRAAQADGARAAGVPGTAGALVLLHLARRRVAGLRELRRHSVPQAGPCSFAGGGAAGTIALIMVGTWHGEPNERVGLRPDRSVSGTGPVALSSPSRSSQPGGEVEFIITVKEYITPKEPTMHFFAQSDKQTNQHTAPFHSVRVGQDHAGSALGVRSRDQPVSLRRPGNPDRRRVGPVSGIPGTGRARPSAGRRQSGLRPRTGSPRTFTTVTP